MLHCWTTLKGISDVSTFSCISIYAPLPLSLPLSTTKKSPARFIPPSVIFLCVGKVPPQPSPVWEVPTLNLSLYNRYSISPNHDSLWWTRFTKCLSCTRKPSSEGSTPDASSLDLRGKDHLPWCVPATLGDCWPLLQAGSRWAWHHDSQRLFKASPFLLSIHASLRLQKLLPFHTLNFTLLHNRAGRRPSRAHGLGLTQQQGEEARFW